MQYWKDANEAVTAVLKLHEKTTSDPTTAPALKTLDLIILYDYSQSGPDCKVWLDARNNQLSYGSGEPPAPADITLILSADDAHLAWSNKFNAMVAIVQKKLVIKGPQNPLMKLAPLTKRTTELYNEALTELGMADKILK